MIELNTPLVTREIVKLNIPCKTPPSFKNRKRAILDSKTNKMRTLTEPEVKQRMQELEDAIAFALFSACQTGANETHLGCSKRLRTALSGLFDDSVREIPCGSWDTFLVDPEFEGIEITIEEIL